MLRRPAGILNLHTCHTKVALQASSRRAPFVDDEVCDVKILEVV